MLECFFHSNEINQNSAVVPGNRSYAITTKYGKKVIVVLNSHLRGINRKLFSNSLLKCRSCLEYFSGARTKELEYYVTSILKDEKPDIIVIDIGFNGSFWQLRLTIENIGKKCRVWSWVFKVTISFILVNIKLTKFIRRLSYILRNLSSVNDFYFISNNMITRDYIR